MKVIKISVIIPVFNACEYIKKCLLSLINNSIAQECEFIIVDDSSVEIIETIINESKLDNIILIKHEKNKGSAAARNTALNIARGEFVICVDSDDWVEYNYLELLYKKAKESNSDITMCGLFKEYNNFSEIINYTFEKKYDYIAALLNEKLPGWLWVKLFKLDFLRRNNIQLIDGLNICEDLIFCIKAFSSTDNISYVNQPLYHYNLTNQNSLTANLNADKVQQLLSAVNLIEELLKDKEQSLSILNFKGRIKIWILKKTDVILPSYITVYNECKLSHNVNYSFSSKLFFWLCEMNLYTLVKILIKLKG